MATMLKSFSNEKAKAIVRQERKATGPNVSYYLIPV